MTPRRDEHPGARGAGGDACFDARLATFTRYAATVSEQFSAALRGDADRARALADERELLAEHFAELRAVAPAAAAPDAPPFDALLAGAIEELDHQMGVELALRQRLATLRDEALRVLHDPHADAAAGDREARAARTAAAALAALDPAAVSGGALSALVATGAAGAAGAQGTARGGAGVAAAYRPGASAHQLDRRF